MERISKIIGLNPLRHKRVHIIQIRGNIDTQMTYKVYKSLKQFKGVDSKAIALIINSQGGSPSQAYMILKRIDRIRRKYNIPLYTFAEDYALSAAFLLHQAGRDKRYCDETTLLGKIATQVVQTKVHSLLHKANIEIRCFSTSQQSFSDQINMFTKTQPTNDLQIVNDYANTLFQNLFKDIYKERQHNMSDQHQNELFDGQIFLGNQTIQFGLCDGANHYTEVLKQDFPGTKFLDLTQKTRREKAIEFFKNFKLQTWNQVLSGIVDMAAKRN